MSEQSVLSASTVRTLGQTDYNKRKQGALEIENTVSARPVRIVCSCHSCHPWVMCRSERPAISGTMTRLAQLLSNLPMT